MELQAVQIQNFMSIQSASLPLTGQGLTLINGLNHDNPSLDNNGAGKSTIIESVVYALFGKTLRGASGDAVVNSIVKKDCTVALMLTDDNGDQYVIIRNRKHRQRKNAPMLLFTPKGAEKSQDITPKSEKDFNAEIERIIGMDYTTFVSSVVYSDSSFKFTSATDAELKQVFDKMLGIGVWADALAETKRRISSVELTLNDCRRREQSARDSVSGYAYQMAQNQQRFKEFNNNEEIRLNTLKSDLAARQQELQQAEAELDEAGKKFLEANDRLQEARNRKQEADNAAAGEDAEYQKYSQDRIQWETDASNIGKLRRRYEDAVRDREWEESEISRIKSSLEEAERNKSDLANNPMNCPYCGQPMTEEHKKSALDEADAVIQRTRESLSRAESELERKKKLESDCQSELQSKQESLDERERELNERKTRLQNSTLREQARKANDAYVEANTAINNANHEVAVKNSKVEITKSSIAEIYGAIQAGKRENPYADSVLYAKNCMDNAQREMEELSAKAEKAEEQLASLKFWEKAFGNSGIKSYILDSVTPFLTKRANFYLSKLAGSRIAVEFETQTRLKSGETREKFSINVTNLDGGNAYFLNSGGERKRVDLAIYFALQDLVASRASKKFNVSFCDEAFDALDDSGFESVMSLLREIASEKSSVFVVTHSDTLKSAFSNIITVEKTGGFSTVVS